MLILVGLTIWRFYFATPPPRIVVVQGETMGTTYTVKVVADTREEQSEQTRAQLQTLVQDRLDAINASMSTYDPNSELSRFNALDANDAFEVSDDLSDVLHIAFEVGEMSEGSLDVTVGPLVDRWGFGPAGELADVPKDSEIDALRRRVGQGHLRFDTTAGSLEKDVVELRVDLSAVAKGYAVDEVSAVLLAQGFVDHMVEVGGEISVRGQTEAQRDWRLAIEEPSPQKRSIHTIVPLSDRAMATSGDYRNFTEVDGRRYSHTIDPTTGHPVTHNLASVTVIAEDCAHADAWATALNVMGPTRGLAFAEQHALAAVFFVRLPDGTIEDAPSKAFAALTSDR